MLLLMRRRLQLFTLAFAFCNVASIQDYDRPVDPNDVEEWANGVGDNQRLLNEIKNPYRTYKSEELAIFSRKSHASEGKYQLYSCIKFDDDHFCKSSVLRWAKLDHKLKGNDFLYDIRKIDIASSVTYGMNERHLIDIDTYRVPYVTVRITDADLHHLAFGFIRSIPLLPALQSYVHNEAFFFEDPSNYCSRFLPDKHVELTGVNAMKTAFYYRYKNRFQTTFAYFFVKGLDTICWYRFEVIGLDYRGNNFDINATGMIDYPSEGYAPHFFAFDQNLGGFASLHWSGNRKDPPYVYFHIFKQNRPEILNYKGGYALTGFDPDVRDDIFKGDYDADAYPAFVSFGQQVFISFTRKGADHEYSGLWSGHNGSSHFIVRRPLDDYQTLVRLRKDYISVKDPEKPYENNYVDDPTETTRKAPTTRKTTKSTTTRSTTTSTRATTTLSTTASASTTSEASTSISSTSEIPDSMPVENYPEDNDYDNHAANLDDGHDGNADKDGCVQIPPALAHDSLHCP